jgi:CheY-like chemotaxis protein
MKGDMEKTIEAGCDGYIAKPIDIQEVLKTIERFLTMQESEFSPDKFVNT